MLWLLPIAAAAVDQLIKNWFFSNPDWQMGLGGNFRIFLEMYLNQGAAFSLPIPASVIAVISSVVIVGLVYLLVKSPTPALRLALVFLLAGALSNLLDRVRLGGVVDYAGIQVFGTQSSTFNIGDVLILIGIVGWWKNGRVGPKK